MDEALKKSKLKLLWRLFYETALISALTLGGGYVIISLIKKKFVEKLKWIGEDEMLDILAVAQSAPGFAQHYLGIAPAGQYDACVYGRPQGDCLIWVD